MVNHPKYGEQFNVDSYERCKPDEKNSIIEFLTSGLFKGIGEKKAKKIVEVLGKDTLNVILENPSNLILIPTITKKNIEDIFVVSRLKDITKIEIPKEETQVEEIKEEKKETPKKESREQLTMSDFFEEFKI